MIEVLSRQEVKRIEDAADSERDKLIVRILADTGLRVGELVKLRQRELLERDRSWYLRVQGKGERERLVPMSPVLARRLLRGARKNGGDERPGPPSGRSIPCPCSASPRLPPSSSSSDEKCSSLRVVSSEACTMPCRSHHGTNTPRSG